MKSRCEDSNSTNTGEVRQNDYSCYEQLPAMLHTADADGRLTAVSELWLKNLGYSRAEVIEQPATRFLSPESQEYANIVCLPRFFAEGFVRDEPMQFVKKNGDIIDVLLSAVAENDPDGDFIRSVAVAVDVTESRNAQKAMEVYQNKLRSLTSELSITEERERRRIASELHDGVVQSLAISKMTLSEILSEPDASLIERSLKDLDGLLDQAISETRTLMYETSPSVLYLLGLSAAIKWQLDQIATRYHLVTHFDEDESEKPLEESLRAFLFRATQELLINVVKHAQAKTINVRLERDCEYVILNVSDDGIGFDGSVQSMEPNLTNGFGLFNIRDRLGYYCGKLEIASERGRGSRVTLYVPFERCK